MTNDLRCGICGANRAFPTNNPLGMDICDECCAINLDKENIKDIDFFCRTVNLPFDPELWMQIYNGEKPFENYANILMSNNETLFYNGSTSDLWSKANAEWEKIKKHEMLLSKIEPLKDGFMTLAEVKWGSNYSFAQYLKMENLLNSTISALQIDNPLTIDTIQKACKIGMEVERAIEQQDVKAIKELTASYSSFMKAADMNEIVTANSKDTIRTVSDIVSYMEELGFKPRYFDGVERDIVDATINDIKKYIQTLVVESTGLTEMLTSMKRQREMADDMNREEEATAELPLEELLKMQTNSQFENDELDLEMSAFEEDEDDDEL